MTTKDILEMKRIECFKIRIGELREGQIWDIKSQNVLLDIFFGKSSLESNPCIIIADPFLFVFNDTLYLFYEEKRLHTDGILKMIKTTDLENWSIPVNVLEEPFHLSYPFVFEEGDQIYMIPETCAVGEVRLYKTESLNPCRFKKECLLLNHNGIKSDVIVDYSDSSVYKHKDGIYYLMTTLNVKGENQLHIYLSDKLEGPYKSHPLSPVCTSREYGRNAGGLIENNGKLYRVAQDCSVRYGDNIHVFEIKELSQTKYKEKIVIRNIIDTSIPFYKEGGHQYSVVQFKGKTILATDAKEYQSFITNRLLNKVKRYCMHFKYKTTK